MVSFITPRNRIGEKRSSEITWAGILGFGFISGKLLKIKRPDKDLWNVQERVQMITRRSRPVSIKCIIGELKAF